jgi:hypothetical protein
MFDRVTLFAQAAQEKVGDAGFVFDDENADAHVSFICHIETRSVSEDEPHSHFVLARASGFDISILPRHPPVATNMKPILSSFHQCFGCRA